MNHVQGWTSFLQVTEAGGFGSKKIATLVLKGRWKHTRVERCGE
jgi:hypothetical protein